MNDNVPSQTQATATPSPAPAAAPPPPAVAIEKKSPKVAGWLSVLFPGTGLLYLGLYQRAFTLAGATILCIVLNTHGGGHVFGPITFFLWVFGIIDAVQQAKAINRSGIAMAAVAPSPQVQRVSTGAGSLTLGVILVGIGALWLADRYLDLDQFFEAIGSWGGPVALVVLGIILIVAHMRKTRQENQAQIGMPPKSQ